MIRPDFKLADCLEILQIQVVLAYQQALMLKLRWCKNKKKKQNSFASSPDIYDSHSVLKSHNPHLGAL